MIEKIDKIQRLLVVENAYSDIETAKENIKALNLLADLKAEIEQLILSSVGCSKIIASVTYWLWQDSGNAIMDDHRETFTKVVEVEKLTDINELFTNVAKIEVLKQ
jgi:hypothetical protein